MAALLIRHGEWVVVCDGAKALVLENDGDIRAPNLKTVQVFEQKDLATHITTRRAVHSILSAAPEAPLSRPTGTIKPNGHF